MCCSLTLHCAARCILQGQAFLFDKDTVAVTHDERGGEVRYQGTWAGDGKRYEVTMRPKGASGQGRLSVAARALQVDLLPDGKPDLAGVWCCGAKATRARRD
jgi:hypothetical protein